MATLAGGLALVTGASGFIGAHLCESLVRAGCRVHGVSRAAAPADARGVAWHRAELADAPTVRELVRHTEPDFVFHLASEVMGAPDIVHVLPTFHANLQTTVNLLTACAEIKCQRLILMGSLVEPGADGERIPSSPYAAAKWAASDYGRMFNQLYGLPVSIARVFMVYGPAQRDVSKLVPYTIRSLQRGIAPKIMNGERLIDWIYVDDVVSGLLAMAEADGLAGDTVDLGSGELISTRDLVLGITSLMQSKLELEFGAVSDRPLEPVRVADIKASFAKTGWQPRTELRDGLRRTIDWYAAAKEERA
jgi:UDP-glucose 4-epimerase